MAYQTTDGMRQHHSTWSPPPFPYIRSPYVGWLLFVHSPRLSLWSLAPFCSSSWFQSNLSLRAALIALTVMAYQTTDGMRQHHSTWSPYDNNGGTCVAIAGANYCVIAADTRMSTGYSILTRDYSKICQLADKCVMASSGFQADIKALQKNLAARHLIYQHQHNKQMSCPAMAQLLSNTLYYKRFFPYYSFNVLGGLDSEGKGCVFTYDAVGSYERVGYGSQGSGSTLLMPVLDNQLKSPSPLLLPAKDAATPLSESEAVDLVKDIFASAAERDIYTGDGVEIVIVNAEGIRRESMELRRD